MEGQENLFVAKARPQRIRISLDHDWLSGDDQLDLSVAVSGTKGEGNAWLETSRLTGPHAHLVATEIILGRLAHFDGLGWDRQPPTIDQAKWERHLFAF